MAETKQEEVKTFWMAVAATMIIRAMSWKSFIVCLALLLPSCTPPADLPETPQTAPEKTFGETLLELHNQVRKEHGSGTLVSDNAMSEYAQKHAETMANKNRLYHSSMSSLSKVSNGGSVAENIAWGQDSEKEAVSDWMGSPGHRWNMLGKTYKRVGFGMAKSKDGSKYWCAVFAD